jgi:hypothetical protein
MLRGRHDKAARTKVKKDTTVLAFEVVLLVLVGSLLVLHFALVDLRFTGE